MFPYFVRFVHHAYNSSYGIMGVKFQKVRQKSVRMRIEESGETLLVHLIDHISSQVRTV